MKLPITKILFLFTLGIAYTGAAYAQTTTPAPTPLLGAAAQMNVNALASRSDANVQTFDNRYQGMKGSPYFMDAWVPGQLEMKVGNTGKTEVYKGLKMKYDVFSNTLIAILPQTKDTLQFSTTPLISFSLESPVNGGPLEFKRFKEAQTFDPALSNTFFAVLHTSPDGQTNLLKRVSKKKIDASFKGAYSAGQTYDELVDETQFYVVDKGRFQRVKLNRKSMVEALPVHAEKLKAYISIQKLAMDSEADLIKVMEYYQSL